MPEEWDQAGERKECAQLSRALQQPEDSDHLVEKGNVHCDRREQKAAERETAELLFLAAPNKLN